MVDKIGCVEGGPVIVELEDTIADVLVGCRVCKDGKSISESTSGGVVGRASRSVVGTISDTSVER